MRAKRNRAGRRDFVGITAYVCWVLIDTVDMDLMSTDCYDKMMLDKMVFNVGNLRR